MNFPFKLEYTVVSYNFTCDTDDDIVNITNQGAAFTPPVKTLVILSQVTPGFTRSLNLPNVYYQVETLIFGRAVERAMHPERFIVGCADPSAPLPAAFLTVRASSSSW